MPTPGELLEALETRLILGEISESRYRLVSETGCRER